MLSGICLVVSAAGCGGEPEEAVLPEDVVLLDPVGIGESYEAAARRNLYDADVYDGLICPYTEEYSLENGRNFDSYAALPGESVKKGQTLMRTNVENLEKQIEEMEEAILRKEEEFQEFCQETEEALEKFREEEEFWGGAVERWAKEQPAEDDPSYESWSSDNLFYETKYRNALISRQMQEEQLRQTTELYRLDADYDQVLLQRLQRKKNEGMVLSGQRGIVANIRLLNYNDYMNADRPMVAVADTDRLLVRCEFIGREQIAGAEKVYAMIQGRRCEVEYEFMESEEYKRLEEKNGKVYTTFYLQEDAGDIEVGSYVAVIVINQSKKDVLSVPKDAVKKDEDGSFVYVLKGGERVYTPIMTGMQDGVYTEVLSGLQEGDRVLTEKDAPAWSSTEILGTGGVSHEFSEQGMMIYPTQEWILCPDVYGTVYFEELKVELYQQVHRGDVLFTFQVKPDEVELERKEKALQRQRERLADLEKKGGSENAKTLEQMRETLAETEKLVEEMKADFAVTEVRAPYDGIVTDLSAELWQNTLEQGDLLRQGQGILMLSKQDSNYIAVEDANGLLSYGNKAAITYTAADGSERETEGQVVTLGPSAVSADLFGEGYALIRVPAEDAADMAGSAFNGNGWWSLSRFGITVTVREMKNVLLVPKKAVRSYGGTTYVRVKQEDGSALYQSFVAGGADDKYYWVAEGLAEGMEVCLD